MVLLPLLQKKLNYAFLRENRTKIFTHFFLMCRPFPFFLAKKRCCARAILMKRWGLERELLGDQAKILTISYALTWLTAALRGIGISPYAIPRPFTPGLHFPKL